MDASLTGWEGDQFGFQHWAMCKATLDFVEHQQSASLASLLQRRPAQCLQHVVDTRGVPKPVEDEAFARLWTASILAMFFCEYGSQTDAAYSKSLSLIHI